MRSGPLYIFMISGANKACIIQGIMWNDISVDVPVMVVMLVKLENEMGLDSSSNFQFHKSVAAAVSTGGRSNKIQTSTNGYAITSGTKFGINEFSDKSLLDWSEIFNNFY